MEGSVALSSNRRHPGKKMVWPVSHGRGGKGKERRANNETGGVFTNNQMVVGMK